MLITPTMMMQILPQLGQFAGMMIGGDKGREIATKSAMLGQIMGAADGFKSFLSPSTGTGGISDSKSFEAFKKNPEGIFGGALPKDMTKLPKDIGGFGKGALKLPEGWNIPKNKGRYEFTPEDALQDPWNHDLKIWG